MSEVNIEINGRKYRMACEDGQEQHLLSLGRRFNEFVDGFKDDFGEIGDNRLTVMAGIAIMDSLVETEKTLQDLHEKYAALIESGSDLSSKNEILEEDFAKRMSEVAEKIELVANALENTSHK